VVSIHCTHTVLLGHLSSAKLRTKSTHHHDGPPRSQAQRQCLHGPSSHTAPLCCCQERPGADPRPCHLHWVCNLAGLWRIRRVHCIKRDCTGGLLYRVSRGRENARSRWKSAACTVSCIALGLASVCCPSAPEETYVCRVVVSRVNSVPSPTGSLDLNFCVCCCHAVCCSWCGPCKMIAPHLVSGSFLWHPRRANPAAVACTWHAQQSSP
jgi:hypothetical protein